jgi:hypothetical protein
MPVRVKENASAPGTRRAAKEECAVTQAITSTDTSRNLLMVAAGGVISGILTPLLPALIDHVVGLPGQLRISLIAVPFAVLVFILVQRFSANPLWAAMLAAVVTMIAFVCAVNAAIFIEGQTTGACHGHALSARRLTGGLVGTAVMALGIGLLPSGPRAAAAWWSMLITGTLAGTLAGARQCARPRPDLVPLSGLAGWRRGAAGDGAAILTGAEQRAAP